MAVMTFAAIDIGSYEVSMKIFEMSKRIGFRELNDVRYSLEIGKGVYSDGKIDSGCQRDQMQESTLHHFH